MLDESFELAKNWTCLQGRWFRSFDLQEFLFLETSMNWPRIGQPSPQSDQRQTICRWCRINGLMEHVGSFQAEEVQKNLRTLKRNRGSSPFLQKHSRIKRKKTIIATKKASEKVRGRSWSWSGNTNRRSSEKTQTAEKVEDEQEEKSIYSLRIWTCCWETWAWSL